MIHLKLTHKKETDVQTLGIMDVYKDGIFQFSLATLELPWRSNNVNVSRVWDDTYIVEPYNSEKHPDTFIVLGTRNRTNILIHIANFVRDLAGCIAVGLTHKDIDEDGYYDVAYSLYAMDKLRDICNGENHILLTIK